MKHEQTPMTHSLTLTLKYLLIFAIETNYKRINNKIINQLIKPINHETCR